MAKPFGISPKNPRDYIGPQIFIIPTVDRDRDPTTSDYKYPIQTIWRNNVDLTEFILVDIAANVANWQPFTAGTPLSIEFDVDIGANVTPNAGVVAVTGAQVSAGTTANGIRSDGNTPNTITLQVNQAGSAGAETVSQNGMAHFNSAQFTVSNGFVSLIGGGPAVQTSQVDTFTAPAITAVVSPTAGNIRIRGGTATAGTTPVQTNSHAVSDYTVEVQFTSEQAASAANRAGIGSFSNAQFDVDSNGFVTLIGSTGPAATKFNVDANTGPGTDPVVPDATGQVTITGAQVAAGTVGANVIRTDSLAANTYTIEIQRSAAVGATASANNGVSHFNSAQFTVDANGFVSLVSAAGVTGVNVDANTPPGTDPVLPDGSGNITVTGAQVATGTIGANVIRTNSLAANTYTIEIQRSTMVAAGDSTKNGVCHFDSTNFLVSAAGFVTLVGVSPADQTNTVDTFTAPAVTAVVSPVAGDIRVKGAAIAASTTPVQSNSHAVGEYTIEVQYTSEQAASAANRAGIGSFSNAQFDVDANGFVTLLGSTGPAATKFNVDVNFAPGTDPVLPDATGQVTITGAQVAAGTIGANVIRTDSLAANTYTIEIQRSTAVAGTASVNNGVSHYSSAQFDVDSNAFVTLKGSTGPAATKFNVDTSSGTGTDPTVPDASGVLAITGGQVATGIIGANVIRTDSTTANSVTWEIQQTTTSAAKDTTKNGVAHFNSAQFTVDEGFVSTIGVGGGAWVLVDSHAFVGDASWSFNTGLTTYTELLLAGTNIGMSSGVGLFHVQFSDDNGATFESLDALVNQATGSGTTSAATNFRLPLSGGTASPYGLWAGLRMNLSGTFPRAIDGFVTVQGGAVSWVGNGMIRSSNQINLIKISNSAGATFNSGTLYLFGR
jgi:hypothetical protein